MKRLEAKITGVSIKDCNCYFDQKMNSFLLTFHFTAVFMYISGNAIIVHVLILYSLLLHEISFVFVIV